MSGRLGYIYESIFVQYWDDEGEEKPMREITWSEDKMHETDVEYVLRPDAEYELKQARQEALQEACVVICPVCRGEKDNTHVQEVFQYDPKIHAGREFWHKGKERTNNTYLCRATNIRIKLMEDN